MQAPTYLSDLVHLYLAMAYGTDQELADEELGALIEKVHAHAPDLSEDDVQEIVAELLTEYLEHGEAIPPAIDTLDVLRSALPETQRRRVLDDLLFIAEADGVVLRAERKLLNTLAGRWEVDLPHLTSPPLNLEVEDDSWGILHDLAFMYLVMAHATDRELTTEEVDTILQKLEDWQPNMTRGRILRIIDAAVERYAQVPAPSALDEAIASVKEHLSRPQLLDVLEDLRQIADADGKVLESEEELLAHLRRSWKPALYKN